MSTLCVCGFWWLFCCGEWLGLLMIVEWLLAAGLKFSSLEGLVWLLFRVFLFAFDLDLWWLFLPQWW